MEHIRKENMFTEYRKIDKLRELQTNFKDNKKRFTRFEFLKSVKLKVYDSTSTGRELPTATLYQSTRLTNPQDLYIQKAVYAVRKSKQSCEYGH